MSSKPTQIPVPDSTEMTLEQFIDQLEDGSQRRDTYGVSPTRVHQHDPQECLQKIAASVGDYFQHPPLDIESNQVSFQMNDDATCAWVTGVCTTQFAREWGRFLKTLKALAPDGVEETHRIDLMWAEQDYDRNDPSPAVGGFEGRADQHLSASIETDELTLTVTYYFDGTLEITGGYTVRAVTGFQTETHYQMCLDAQWDPTDKPQARVTRDTLREHSYYAAQVRSQYLWNQKQTQRERARRARDARSDQAVSKQDSDKKNRDESEESDELNRADILWVRDMPECQNSIDDDEPSEDISDDDAEDREIVEENSKRCQSAASETPLHDML